MIGAVGVDTDGHKYVLAMREGAAENATISKDLPENMVVWDVNPAQKRLFVIDGSKAPYTAVNAVFGNQHPVQSCRAHRLRNVMEYLRKIKRLIGCDPQSIAPVARQEVA